MSHSTSPKQSPSTTACPTCNKPVAAPAEGDADSTYPFCSARCRKIDLGKWLSEDYVISRPIEQSDLDEE